MVKKIAVLFLLILPTVFLGGCWDRKELNEVAVVLGTGIDWMADGRVRLAVQIARPTAFAGGGEAGGGGRDGTAASWVVSAEGKTVEDARVHLAAKIPREIYWGHGVILVLGEEMARKGTNMVTNFFLRDRQSRETMWVMVTKGEAKDFLETFSAMAKTSAQAAGFLNVMKTGYSVRLSEFSEMMASKGVQPVATWVGEVEAGVIPGLGQEMRPSAQRQVGLLGSAVFKDDRLVGWLDSYETRGLLWLKGEAMRGVITVPSPGEPDKEVSIRIRRGRTRIVPEYDGEYLWFDVEVEMEGDVLEQQSSEDLAKPEKIEALEGEVAEAVKERATAVLEKVRREYQVDVFGFGNAFHRKYKKDWRELKDRWDEEFKRAEVNITVKSRIRDTGLLTKRASMPEE
ncbi:MAG: Ger(x)C family spore germination protein [Pelotomaculum sp.]|uniref:Hypothetical membrane protein n=1 Tax=Pelotomaculum thermopropionicum (strain DSM 13744 / JCM 10971 / SI) TaxID=370438 RepID=A5D160_PELTS|nr:Ger(x)C family spore germination protein [Pelotomaculum sp.]BAF60019.1 hypothetical membrane protein [Pelotomaculum thermopropionicum SI]